MNKLLRCHLVLSTFLLLAGCNPPEPSVTQAHWSGGGKSLVFDHHLHTRFSDGAEDLESLVKRSVDAGCNALVISDHSDTPGTASLAYFDAIDRMRLDYPEVLLFAGMEMEMPSYSGREHVGVLLEPKWERQLLPQLKVDLSKQSDESQPVYELDKAALASVRLVRGQGSQAALIYNHPSRRDQSSLENVSDLLFWKNETQGFIGVAGAPGHQRAEEPGDYSPPILTRDGWDPMVADVGGGLDRLLAIGNDVWGAIAGSDYHNDRLDYVPCDFSRTHVEVSEKTYAGVLAALHAGTFWSDHGRLLEELRFSMEFESSLQLARPGAEVKITERGGYALLHVDLKRGPGGDDSELRAEAIGNCASGEVEILANFSFAANSDLESAFIPLNASGDDGESCFVRLRVFDSASSLFAYSNHIRIFL